MEEQIPAYQSIDILLGKHSNPIKPIVGWYIEIPDQQARDLVRKISNNYQFAYTQDEADEKIEYVRTVSKYPTSIYANICWIHEEGHRLYRTPR